MSSSPTVNGQDARCALLARYDAVRGWSEQFARPLEPEDCVVQSMPDVSPTKWHLAHTSWFFETFVLKPNVADYQSLHPQYDYLFNSYYNSVGERHCRPKRGLVSRPTVSEVFRYRTYVDEHMRCFIEGMTDTQWQAVEPVVTLGLHHEQQHQELMVTDIKHVFSENPLAPAYRENTLDVAPPLLGAGVASWITFDEGLRAIGDDGQDGFIFDNEGPRHREFVPAFQLASRLVTNREWLAFMEDGGYERPEFWLSEGWGTVQREHWKAPLYWWKKRGTDWHEFTLAGMRLLELDEPVCHISLFEADAYAQWAGARLPTEAEWEVASQGVPVCGGFVESEAFHPAPAKPNLSGTLDQMYGEVWQWTRSQYTPYPGFKTLPGALGEYNGKFMCNQFVLRGGSCATSQTHIRPTYRNFFPPDARWQFTGLRLAKDAETHA
jgi:ergothioneine biosynthesis protein EgtB